MKVVRSDCSCHGVGVVLCVLYRDGQICEVIIVVATRENEIARSLYATDIRLMFNKNVLKAPPFI